MRQLALRPWCGLPKEVMDVFIPSDMRFDGFLV